jgi:hypothetical protein
MAAPSKNQRVHPKQQQKEFRCSQGHKRVDVRVSDIMRKLCVCNGYEPIDLKAPYASIRPDGVPGKKRDGQKAPNGGYTVRAIDRG